MRWLALFSVVSACTQSGAEEQAPVRRAPLVPVEVETIGAQRVDYELEAVGAVEAFESVQITARVAGVVEKMSFKEGDTLERGALLAEIEPRRYELAYAAAKAALDGVKAVGEEAARELERGEKMLAEGIATNVDVDTWRTRVATAQANRSQAEASLGLAALNLRDARVRAPVKGVVQMRGVETGQYVAIGKVLATLLQRDPLQLRFKVNESEAASLHPGMIAKFRVKDDTEEHQAKLTFVAEAAESTTRMVPVRAEIVEEGSALRPGAFAEVVVPIGSAAEAIVVPESAVRPSERGFLAFVIENDAARERVVNLGMRTGHGGVEVRSGLSLGERLVVRGGEGLAEGTQVRVVGAASSGSAGTSSGVPSSGVPSNGAGPAKSAGPSATAVEAR